MKELQDLKVLNRIIDKVIESMERGESRRIVSLEVCEKGIEDDPVLQALKKLFPGIKCVDVSDPCGYRCLYVVISLEINW